MERNTRYQVVREYGPPRRTGGDLGNRRVHGPGGRPAPHQGLVDPAWQTTSEYAIGRHGWLMVIALLLLPLAVLLVSVSLARKNPDWSPVRGLLAVAAALPILALVMFMTAQAVLVPSGGHFGPGANIGWPERIQGLLYVAATVVAAWSAIRVRRQTGSAPVRAESPVLTKIG